MASSQPKYALNGFGLLGWVCALKSELCFNLKQSIKFKSLANDWNALFFALCLMTYLS